MKTFHRTRFLVSPSLLLCLVVLGLLLTGPARAAGQGVHQHGHGELNVIAHGHDLVLELRLPAADVVGFEHAPEGKQQIDLVQQVLAGFESGAGWFEPAAAAACQLESAQGSLGGLSSKRHEKESHSHARHEHHEHQKESEHSDFEGLLEYHCDKPSELVSVKVLFFEFIGGVTEVNGQLVTSERQSRVRLSPDQPVLLLSQ